MLAGPPFQTTQGPNVQTAGNWRDFLGAIGQLGLDVARNKLIDVERVSDDDNIPDQADLRSGLGAPAFAGLTIGGALLLVGVVVGAGFLIARLAK